MAHGKSQFATWFCPTCKMAKKTTAYPKNRNDEIVKVLSMFCNQCRGHEDHKRKDTKKGN